MSQSKSWFIISKLLHPTLQLSSPPRQKITLTIGAIYENLNRYAMFNFPENHTSRLQDQTTPRIKYLARSRFPPTYTPPPPPQFMPTFGAEGSTPSESTPMTYEQYFDLKNEYQTMEKELKRYNEFRASQQGPTASRQYSQRPNLNLEQYDSQKTQTSLKSWKLRYFSTERSNEASEPSSTKSRKRRKRKKKESPRTTRPTTPQRQI